VLFINHKDKKEISNTPCDKIRRESLRKVAKKDQIPREKYKNNFFK